MLNRIRGAAMTEDDINDTLLGALTALEEALPGWTILIAVTRDRDIHYATDADDTMGVLAALLRELPDKEDNG